MSGLEALQWLAALVGALAAMLGTLGTLWRMARPRVREEARAVAVAVADTVRTEVKALGERLALNDFPHVEARIGRVEARINDRLREARADREAMESRIMAALSGRADPDTAAPE